MAQIEVLAPLDGTVVELATVPDEVFAQGMAGDGLAIDPSGDVAVAPLGGLLAKLFPGGHAFGLAASGDIELIVHLGLDTVELKGLGFTLLAAEGQVVQAGTPIVRFDRSAIERAGKAMISPIVSSGAGRVVHKASGTVRAGRDVLFVLEL